MRKPSQRATKTPPAQLQREIAAVLASPRGIQGLHDTSLRGHSTMKSNDDRADRAEAIAYGNKWAEERFREDPNYHAFTLDMVEIDPTVVVSAKKREALKNLICDTAAKRWRALAASRAPLL